MDIRIERIFFPMHVLAEIYPPWTEMRKHFLQCDDLMFRLVTAVVNEDINGRILLLKSFPEPPI